MIFCYEDELALPLPAREGADGREAAGEVLRVSYPRDPVKKAKNATI